MTNQLSPTPKHSAWVAIAVVFPALLIALLILPIWAIAYGAMRLMQVLKRSRANDIPISEPANSEADTEEPTRPTNGQDSARS